MLPSSAFGVTTVNLLAAVAFFIALQQVEVHAEGGCENWDLPECVKLTQERK
jgi:hypothetical protein